jgi:VWA domain containing CoxE-like protein
MPYLGHTSRNPGVVTVPDEWQPWSNAWTRQARLLTGRTDLSVHVAPGAGHGSPACFLPDPAVIEVDANHIGPPDIADPRRAGHKKLVPTGYGLLVHEAAHAAHSHWNTPTGTPAVVAAAANLLEESRAEGRQRARRRGDRRWLQHTVTALITTDDAPVDDPWHAGQVAGLILARVDARILTARQARTARGAVQHVLGRPRLRALRDIWRQAHGCPDHDADQMIELGRRWCQTLGINPDQQPDIPLPDPGSFPGQLAAALNDLLAAAAGLTPRAHATATAATAHKAPATWTTRPPTVSEQQAARGLGRRIRQARTQPEPAARPSPVPPGRLRTRHAITAQAQAAAGTIPTATPWRQRAHQLPPRPKLHLAVLVDVSGSMDAYRQAMSSAAWILAHAPNPADAATTTIAFGSTATLLQQPERPRPHVLEMLADGATTAFPQAVKLADQLLGLRQRGPLRMLAVVSDGWLEDEQAAQKLITTLHRSGCAVLWLHPDPADGPTYTDTTRITVADPVTAMDTIADAALTALSQATAHH